MCLAREIALPALGLAFWAARLVSDLEATFRDAIAVEAQSIARNPGGRLTRKPARNRQTKSDAS